MSSRIAKPGAAKFKPVRQAPKKPPNPAAVRAAAPSGPSPSPAPVAAPALAATPAPARPDAPAAKEPVSARKADAVTARTGVAIDSADSQERHEEQPTAAPSGTTAASDSTRPTAHQEGQGHSKDAPLPQASSATPVIRAPVQQRSAPPVPPRATGSAISFGSLAAFEAQHNSTQPSPPSSPPSGAPKPELPARTSKGQHAPRSQRDTISPQPQAVPVLAEISAVSKVGRPSVNTSQTPILEHSEQHAHLPSEPQDITEQGPAVGRTLEEPDWQPSQTPISERLAGEGPAPPALPQAGAALDPALDITQRHASPHGVPPQQATHGVVPLPGLPQAQEIPLPPDAQLPPLPPDSMLNSDDALMELIRAEVNAADENAADTDEELEGSIYAHSGVGRDSETLEPQDAAPNGVPTHIDTSSGTTRSGRKRATPAGASKKGPAAKRPRAEDNAAAEPGTTTKGKSKSKGKGKAKAKPKPKPKVQETRAPPAEKNTVPRNFQPSVAGATLTMADILRGLDLPPPRVVTWRTGQDAPADRSARPPDGSASVAISDADAAGRVSRAQESEQEEEEEEAGDLALEGTRAIDPLAPLDPSRITMKSLIRDSGRGRPSSFMQRKIENRNEKRVRMAAARERMKLQVQLEREGVSKEEIRRRLDGKQKEQEQEMADGGEVADDDLENGTPAPSVSESGLENEEADNEADRQSEEGETNVGEGDEDDGFAESQYAPQMRFVNGEMVVDEASTQIARTTNDYNSYEVIEHENTLAHITSYTYGKAQRRKAERATAGQRTGRWTMADTQLFYEGLSQFGTDFEMIAGMFAYRDRRQIKSKWVREEKLNPERIDAALSVKKEVNLEYYQAITKMELDGDTVPADPMTRFYEGLPTKENLITLASNRPPSTEPEMEAEIRRKKEETQRLSQDAETARDGAEEPGAEAEGSQAGVDEGVEDSDRPLFNPASDDEGEAGEGNAGEEAQDREPEEDEGVEEDEQEESFDMSSFAVPIKSTA